MRIPEFLPIEFAVVGGSICGLSCAIALSRAGHKVTVFDPLDPLLPNPIDAGTRLAPNATKVFYRWGIEQRLRACSIKSTGIMFASYHSGSVVGGHEWEEEVLEETGGDFLLMHHSDLRRILAECALEHGAKFRCPSLVSSLQADRERPSVTLDTGEVVTVDVVICADGCILPGWVGRPTILEAYGRKDDFEVTGMQFFNILVPESALDKLKDKETLQRLRKSGKMYIWFGPQYGALGYPVKAPTTGDPLFTMFIYAPRKTHDQEAYNTDTEELLNAMKDADPLLVELASHASSVSCVPMIDRPALEEWIHPDGRIICLGESAHPTFGGSMYALGMSAGDAAVIGRVFSHLHCREQIDSFLNAVQEIRQSRVENVIKTATGNIFAVSLPPGIAGSGDRKIYARAERGIKQLRPSKIQANEEVINTVEHIFAYDPDDEADNWWVQWGLMEERMAKWNLSTSVSVVVEKQMAETEE